MSSYVEICTCIKYEKEVGEGGGGLVESTWDQWAQCAVGPVSIPQG